MFAAISLDEPPERSARLLAGRATYQVTSHDPSRDREVRAALGGWLDSLLSLEVQPLLTPLTRLKVRDGYRVCAELVNVLDGREPGEGTPQDRTLLAARSGGRIQAVSSMFACAGGTFIELLVTAPWNLLGRGDPVDARTVRGAGTALVEHAKAWSRWRGCGGRIALQAENPRTLTYYEHLGFTRMAPSHRPLTLVPRGATGWSPSILRVACGTPGAEEELTPWLVLDAGQVPLAAPATSGAPAPVRRCA